MATNAPRGISEKELRNRFDCHPPLTEDDVVLGQRSAGEVAGMSAYETTEGSEPVELSVLDRVSALESRLGVAEREHRRLMEFVGRLARVVGIDAPKDL